ncbi:hypothetical protein U1Q18_013517 [Sarracenia purpurea var. burkii]
MKLYKILIYLAALTRSIDFLRLMLPISIIFRRCFRSRFSSGISGDPFADDDDDDFVPATNGDLPPPNESGNSDFPPPSGGGNKECVSGTVEFHCQCPAVCDCPLTLEPKDFVKLRENLAPVVRERLRGLLNKALTIESAKEVAHSIDLLKPLNESNPKLNTIRNVVHKGAQVLAHAFKEIPNHIYY